MTHKEDRRRAIDAYHRAFIKARENVRPRMLALLADLSAPHPQPTTRHEEATALLHGLLRDGLARALSR